MTYCPPCSITEEETEAQRGEATSPGTHSRSVSESKQDLESTSYPTSPSVGASSLRRLARRSFKGFLLHGERAQRRGSHCSLLPRPIERETKSTHLLNDGAFSHAHKSKRDIISDSRMAHEVKEMPLSGQLADAVLDFPVCFLLPRPLVTTDPRTVRTPARPQASIPSPSTAPPFVEENRHC